MSLLQHIYVGKSYAPNDIAYKYSTGELYKHMLQGPGDAFDGNIYTCQALVQEHLNGSWKN